MNVLSNQFTNAISNEEKIRRKGLMNRGGGFVGNGFYWGMYPMSTDQYSGYGGYMTAATNEPVSGMGDTASSDGPGGDGGMGGSGGGFE